MFVLSEATKEDGYYQQEFGFSGQPPLLLIRAVLHGNGKYYPVVRCGTGRGVMVASDPDGYILSDMALKMAVVLAIKVMQSGVAELIDLMNKALSPKPTVDPDDLRNPAYDGAMGIFDIGRVIEMITDTDIPEDDEI